jgi:hypothetical protein
MQVLGELEEGNACVDHYRALRRALGQVQVQYFVDLLGADDDGCWIVATHGILPHVSFPTRSHRCA